jgi:hypothetical protein
LARLTEQCSSGAFHHILSWAIKFKPTHGMPD